MSGAMVVVPCSAEKSKIPCDAGSMYLGQLHKLAMQAAQSLVHDAEIRVLSGKYGLLRLDDEIWPYEQRIDKPGAVGTDTLSEQLLCEFRLSADGLVVVSLCPKSYTAVLRTAAEFLPYVQLIAPLDGAAGIGVIRQRLAHIRRAGWAQLPLDEGVTQ